MTKVFIFMIMVCSTAAKTCLPLPQAEKIFYDYRECALYGYKFSLDFLTEFDPDKLRNDRVYTTFVCQPQQTI